jgi:signal transduction histidine kinase
MELTNVGDYFTLGDYNVSLIRLEVPLRLADFIISELEPILQEWDNFARTLTPAAMVMTDKELRNHAGIMLRAIADDLRTSQSPEQQVKKSHGWEDEEKRDADHGAGRWKSRFSVEQLVSEYRALRSSVLRLWGKARSDASTTDIEDIIRFNEAIDQLLALSVLSFADAQRKADEREKNRNDFLAMLAHELRNPLSPISTASALLKKAKGNEKIIESATDVIARQVTHMAGLVDDLLDVSRVTRGLIEVQLSAVDIRQAIDEAVEQVIPQIQTRRQQLDVAGPPYPTAVHADKKRLVQIVTNLLTNAAKYTPEGGHLQLEMTVHEGEVVIAVEDNGVGMSPEFISHAFELFAQAERTPDRAAGGLGLGLALVKNLVELHGGKVACSSAGLGQGSRFVVSLPRYQGSGKVVERSGTLLS